MKETTTTSLAVAENTANVGTSAKGDNAELNEVKGETTMKTKKYATKEQIAASKEKAAKRDTYHKVNGDAAKDENAEILVQAKAKNDAECERTLAEFNQECERVYAETDSPFAAMPFDAALIDKAVKHACALVAAKHLDKDALAKIEALKKKYDDKMTDFAVTKLQLAELQAEYDELGDDSTPTEEQELLDEMKKAKKAAEKLANEAATVQDKLEQAESEYAVCKDIKLFGEGDELVVYSRFILPEDIALHAARKEYAELKLLAENGKHSERGEEIAELKAEMEQLDADDPKYAEIRDKVEKLQAKNDLDMARYELDAEGNVIPEKQEKVIPPTKDELKASKAKVKQCEDDLDAALRGACRIAYKVGLTNEKRPNDAKRIAFEIAEMANFVLGVSQDIAVTRVNFNPASDRSTNPQNLPIIEVASRGVAKTVAKKSVQREGNKTQWNIENAANRGDWEHHDLADMVSAAKEAMMYIGQPDETLETYVDEVKNLVDATEDLKHIAIVDTAARTVVANRFDYTPENEYNELALWNCYTAAKDKLEVEKAKQDKLAGEVQVKSGELKSKLLAEISDKHAALKTAENGVDNALAAMKQARRNYAEKLISEDAEVAARSIHLALVQRDFNEVVEKAQLDAQNLKHAEKFGIGELIFQTLEHAEAHGFTAGNIETLLDKEEEALVAVREASNAYADLVKWDKSELLELGGIEGNYAVLGAFESVSLQRMNAANDAYLAVRQERIDAETGMKATEMQLAELLDDWTNCKVNDGEVMRSIGVILKGEKVESAQNGVRKAEVVALRKAYDMIAKYEGDADYIERSGAAKEYWEGLPVIEAIPELDAAILEYQKAVKLRADAYNAYNAALKVVDVKMRKNGELSILKVELAKQREVVKASRRAVQDCFDAYRAGLKEFEKLGARRISDDHRRVQSRYEVLELSLNAAFAMKDAEASGDVVDLALAAEEVANAAYRAINMYLGEIKAIRVDFANTPISLDDEMNNTIADPRDKFGVGDSEYRIIRRMNIRKVRDAVYAVITDLNKKYLEALIKTGGNEIRAAELLHCDKSTVCRHRAEIARLFDDCAKDVIPNTLERHLLHRIAAECEESAEIAKMRVEEARKKKAVEKVRNMTSAEILLAAQATKEKLASVPDEIAKEIANAEQKALEAAAKKLSDKVEQYEQDAASLEHAVDEKVLYMKARCAAISAYDALPARMKENVQASINGASCQQIADAFHSSKGAIGKSLKNAAIKMSDAVIDKFPELSVVMVRLAARKAFDDMLNFNEEIRKHEEAEEQRAIAEQNLGKIEMPETK